jgi:hypothetical protein
MSTTAKTSCSFVATLDLIRKLNPDREIQNRHHNSVPGIMSCDIVVHPEQCKTAFGRWLAERVWTTRRDDDLSRVRVTLGKTEAEIAMCSFATELQSQRIRDSIEFSLVLKRMEGWATYQRNIQGAYGDHLYAYRTIDFEWPVLGSRAAEGIEEPAAFFDLCAARIRAMKPRAVRVHDGQQPPVSLQVCG